MAQRKFEERHIRKISKSGGGSFYISLPIEMVRELKWKKDQKVVVKKTGKMLKIEDWK